MATVQKETWFSKAAVVTASASNHPACPSALLALPAVDTKHSQKMWIVKLQIQLMEESITPLSLCLLLPMEQRITTQLDSTSAADYSSPAYSQDITIN